MVEYNTLAVDYSLKILLAELFGVKGLDEYVIFGSTSLYINGVLDRLPNDIDLFVTKRVWGALLPRDNWIVETPTAGDPPILTHINIPVPIHAFFDWDNRSEMNPATLLDSAVVVYYNSHEFRVISVEDAIAHKERALLLNPQLTKHRMDLRSI